MAKKKTTSNNSNSSRTRTTRTSTSKSATTPSTPRTRVSRKSGTQPVQTSRAALSGTTPGSGGSVRIGGDGATMVTPVLSHDQIAKRAYEIWVAKGRPEGQDDANWREAEQDLFGSAR